MSIGLRVAGLTVRFGDHLALDDVTLDLGTGGVLAVLGPSGSGKSTLLRAVAGLEPVSGGSVHFGDEELTATPVHRRGFALMFQDGQLFPHRSVAQNVAYPLRLRHATRAKTSARVAELLDLVGLAGQGDRRPLTLSGGEQQRVALARALAVRPRLLLLDEPLAALDRGLRERLAVDLRNILAAEATPALLVTHDHDEAFAVASRMALLRAGRLVQSGPVDQVWSHPADADAARFLGYADVLEGERAQRFQRLAGSAGPGGTAVALRRSALQAVPVAGASLSGVVVEARVAGEQTRVRVDVDGLGVLHAVAERSVAVPVGGRVGLSIDLSRTARVGAG